MNNYLDIFPRDIRQLIGEYIPHIYNCDILQLYAINFNILRIRNGVGVSMYSK